jgi:hypothetical protein
MIKSFSFPNPVGSSSKGISPLLIVFLIIIILVVIYKSNDTIKKKVDGWLGLDFKNVYQVPVKTEQSQPVKNKTQLPIAKKMDWVTNPFDINSKKPVNIYRS